MQAVVSRPERCVTVHSGVDLNKFSVPIQDNILRKEYNLSGDTVLIGNTSALEDHKDYFTFIDTIDILVRKGVNVKGFIIGKGSLEQSLKAYAEGKNLGNDIFFTGFRTNIIELLPCLDIFLMTSKEEGLGTSVLDAFLAGVPVVSTNAGGIPEMVIHERTGLVADIKDSASLAENIFRLIHDNYLKQELIKGAKQKVTSEFSKETTGKGTLTVYLQVAVGES